MTKPVKVQLRKLKDALTVFDKAKHEIYCAVYNKWPRHFDDDDECTCGGQK